MDPILHCRCADLASRCEIKDNLNKQRLGVILRSKWRDTGEGSLPCRHACTRIPRIYTHVSGLKDLNRVCPELVS